MLDLFCCHLLQSILTLHSLPSPSEFSSAQFVFGEYNEKGKRKNLWVITSFFLPFLWLLPSSSPQSVLPAVRFGVASCPISAVLCVGMGEARQLFS